MTPFDRVLADLAQRIDVLPRRSIAALFLACGHALSPAFRQWVAHRGEDTEPLLERALATANNFALTGEAAPGVHELLASMEAATPQGDSPDEVASATAQDCWICADIGVRVIADPSYAAGTGIEYALEPVVHRATERLYGVSQLGSSPDESSKIDEVLRQPDVAAALTFCTWALTLLEDHPTITEDDLTALKSQATALAS